MYARESLQSITDFLSDTETMVRERTKDVIVVYSGFRQSVLLFTTSSLIIKEQKVNEYVFNFDFSRSIIINTIKSAQVGKVWRIVSKGHAYS